MLVRTDPEHAPPRLPLDPARPARRDPRATGPRRSTPPSRSAARALAIRTVAAYTGIPVNHIVVVDFAEFRDLIDEVGGIDVVVPEKILSKFDCPYGSEARCARWPGWRFAAGKQHMNGRRALIYSRVRKNPLDPAESDITRGERNQAVLQALMSKLAGFGTLMRMPLIGRRPDEAARDRPLARTSSSSSAGPSFRAGRTLHCRLGGDRRQAATSRRARTTRR